MLNKKDSHIITLNNIYKKFNDQILFKDISIEFKQSFSYAIMGVSGTGKSTLLSLIAGMDQPNAGTITFDQEPITPYNNHIALVFQSPYLINELTVLENIMIKGLISGLKLQVCKDRAFHLLELIGLSNKAHMHPAILSGGEKQRIALARALFIPPKFLLADEPTAHLDEKNKEEIIKLLKEYQSKENMGLIITCHDPIVACQLNIIYHITKESLKLYN